MKKFFTLFLLCTLISVLAVFSACGSGITDSTESTGSTGSDTTASDSTGSDSTASDITSSDISENDSSDDSGEINESTKNTKAEVPTGVTPSAIINNFDASANTLYYLAYVLDQQEYYHVEATNVSGSSIGKATTKTEKDYASGIMIASEITYGMVKSASQTCYVTDTDGSITAYRRSGSGASSSSTVGTISWDDTYTDTNSYSRDEYLYIYGEYATEMSVYFINERTIDTYSQITDNGNGTYSQTFTFKSTAALYYKYAMYTNGGLEDYPEFESINMTVTFDENWQVLEIYVAEDMLISAYSLVLENSAETTTTFSYGESSINTENYSYYESYFEKAIPYTTAYGSETDYDTETVKLLMFYELFNDSLTSSGDQFAFTTEIGGKTFYGLIYLENMEELFFGDYNNTKVKLAIFPDENYENQQLYIEFENGEFNIYYSSGFTDSYSISELTEVLEKFAEWLNLVFDDSSSSSSLAIDSFISCIYVETDENGNILTDEDGNFTFTIVINDLSGISINATINAEATEDYTVYTFIGATIDISGISYNDGEALLILMPTDTEEIVYDSSQTPFDLRETSENINQ